MKVLLVHSGSCEPELRQLRHWLEAENCEVAIVDLNHPDEQSQTKAITESVSECDSVVVLMDSQLPLPEVQVAILAANAKGKKILGVKLAAAVVVDALEKFGSSLIGFNRELIIDAVCEDRFAWTDEEGRPREEPETERHKCKKPANRNAAA